MKNFGIIGGGMIARFHAQALAAMQGGQLHSIYDQRAEAAEKFAQEQGIKAFSSLDEFLADPELDVVTIATPSGSHLEPALAAIRAGKHVAAEKPLEITVERVDEMINAAAQAGVKLVGILNRRFAPAVLQFKKAVEDGRFGQLSIASAIVPWYRTEAYYNQAAWRGTWALDGGGALMNQGIHTVDQLLYVVGPISRVSATMATVAHPGLEVEDTVAAMVEFASGARGSILASTACWSATGHPAEVHLYGSTGSAALRDTTLSVWDFETPAPQDEEVRASLQGDAGRGLGANDPTAIDFYGHQRVFEDLVQAIENDTEPAVDGREARKAVAVIRAIYESAQSGGAWVEVK